MAPEEDFELQLYHVSGCSPGMRHSGGCVSKRKYGDHSKEYWERGQFLVSMTGRDLEEIGGNE